MRLYLHFTMLAACLNCRGMCDPWNHQISLCAIIACRYTSLLCAEEHLESSAQTMSAFKDHEYISRRARVSTYLPFLWNDHVKGHFKATGFGPCLRTNVPPTSDTIIAHLPSMLTTRSN